jgi:hypothetical protein
MIAAKMANNRVNLKATIKSGTRTAQRIKVAQPVAKSFASSMKLPFLVFSSPVADYIREEEKRE